MQRVGRAEKEDTVEMSNLVPEKKREVDCLKKRLGEEGREAGEASFVGWEHKRKGWRKAGLLSMGSAGWLELPPPCSKAN